MKSFRKLSVLAFLAAAAVFCIADFAKCAEARQSEVAFRPRQQSTTATCPVKTSRKYRVGAHQKGSSPLIIRGGAVENTLTNAFVGSAVMALIEKVVKEVFKVMDIKFPSQLGACLFLFLALLLTEKVNVDAANAVFSALSPGSALLAKWLPVFFVPGLAMLPLAPPIGDGMEILKVLSVVTIGFVYTITTTGFAVLSLRKAQGAISKSSSSRSSTSAGSAVAKPFSDQTMSLFLNGAIVLGLSSIVATKTDFQLATPIQTAFLGFATTAAYVWGARLPASFTKVVHPLVTSCVILLTLVKVLGLATGREFLDVLRTFKTGSLHPMKAGAGDVLLYLLGPSVVSFSISMYSRRQLLKSNLFVVAMAMLVSSVGGLFGTAFFVRAIGLGGPNGAMVRLSVLSRNVTTALAMAVTELLGGDISIAASVVVLTGILGATYGKTFLTALGITDPVTRGLAIGASSQGLGVASISNEVDAFPFAAISMVLTAICATTLVSIPAVKETLIQLATGK